MDTRSLSLCYMLLIFLPNLALSQEKRLTKDFGTYFQEYGVKGSFLLYNLKKDQYIQYDPQRCQTRFIPASTFKIPNSLIGLETGVITGKDFTLKWDGVDRGNTNWNRDHNLKSAFHYSAVWYYQEIARRIGEKRMQEYLDKLNYGNRNIAGEIDKFWLTGELRISQEEQIDFIKKLYLNQLPVSKRSMDIVKDIMVLQDTLGQTLRGKTGWATFPDQNIGWFVGYLEEKDNAYFFATNLEAGQPAPEKFIESRRKITENILRELKLLK